MGHFSLGHFWAFLFKIFFIRRFLIGTFFIEYFSYKFSAWDIISRTFSNTPFGTAIWHSGDASKATAALLWKREIASQFRDLSSELKTTLAFTFHIATKRPRKDNSITYNETSSLTTTQYDEGDITVMNSIFADFIGWKTPMTCMSFNAQVSEGRLGEMNCGKLLSKVSSRRINFWCCVRTVSMWLFSSGIESHERKTFLCIKACGFYLKACFSGSFFVASSLSCFW